MKDLSLQEKPSLLSIIPLIIVNLIPLIGVLFLDWSLFQVLFLYWTESGVIGVYNIFKLIKVSGWASVLVVPFFIIHYGMFMGIHLMFLVGFFGSGLNSNSFFPSFEVLTSLFRTVAVPTMILVISHGISFFWNFIGHREYEHTNGPTQMNAPYKRIVIMHLTIIFGAWVVVAFKEPILGVVLLVVLKIIIDLFSHLNAHGVLRVLQR